MKASEAREVLRDAKDRLSVGDTATAVERIDRVLAELAPERLVSTADAARLLGIRSEYILRLLCKQGVLNCGYDGDCVRVPLSEIDRAMDSPEVREIRALDRLHDLTEKLGAQLGLSEGELAELSASRPGTLPWQRK